MLHAVFLTAGVASKIAAQQEQRRIDLGLPLPPTPPEKSPEEIKKDRRDDRIAETLFWACVFIPALFVASFVGLFLFTVIKIVFAVQGQKFP